MTVSRRPLPKSNLSRLTMAGRWLATVLALLAVSSAVLTINNKSVDLKTPKARKQRRKTLKTLSSTRFSSRQRRRWLEGDENEDNENQAGDEYQSDYENYDEYQQDEGNEKENDRMQDDWFGDGLDDDGFDDVRITRPLQHGSYGSIS